MASDQARQMLRQFTDESRAIVNRVSFFISNLINS